MNFFQRSSLRLVTRRSQTLLLNNRATMNYPLLDDEDLGEDRKVQGKQKGIRKFFATLRTKLHLKMFGNRGLRRYTRLETHTDTHSEDTITDDNEARMLHTALQQLGNKINQFARFSRASYQQRLTCCEMCGWVSTRGNSDTYTIEQFNRMLHDVERKTDELMSVLEHQFTDI